MGSPVSSSEQFGGEQFGGEDGFGDAETPSSEKPFDDEPFDAGVEASEEDSPEKYIQQISGKLGQSLRKYTDEMGQPDFDLEKFAINSVLSATNSGKMDQGDQADIIQKVKSSSTDGSGGNGVDHDEAQDGAQDGDQDGDQDDLDASGEGGFDLSGVDMAESVLEKKSDDDLLEKKVYVANRKEMGIVKKIDGEDIVVQIPKTKELVNVRLADIKEITEDSSDKSPFYNAEKENTEEYKKELSDYEKTREFNKEKFTEDVDESHNPNANGKTVFQDATLGVKEDGMEENKYLNLENNPKSSSIANMVKESLRTVEPQVKPPQVKPQRETRRSKPYRIIPEQLPDPEPKAEKKRDEIKFIKDSGFSKDGDAVTIAFEINGEMVTSNFINTGEVLTKPLAYNESWVFAFESDLMPNGKTYGTAVAFFGHPQTNLDLEGYADGDIPEIEEV